MFENIFIEMATRGRCSARRMRKISLLLIYLFVCINQGQGVTSMYESADHYWPMKNVSANTSLDVIGLYHASVHNGAKLNTTNLFGKALILDGLDDCIIIDLLAQDCTNTPSKCRNGFTIAFWLYYIRGEFLLCAGAYTNADEGPGIKFTFDEEKKLFVLDISTVDSTWSVTTRIVKRTWVHVAFTWSMEEGLQLYLNGSPQTAAQSAKKVRFELPNFNNGWTLGRPNELLKLDKYGSFGIAHLALWLQELTDYEIKTAYLETIIADPYKVTELVDHYTGAPNTTKEESKKRDTSSEATSISAWRFSWFSTLILLVISR